MKKQHKQICKVLPFDTKHGDVPGHEIAAYSFDDRDPVCEVVFQEWDSEARMMTKTHIHWTNVTEWMRRKYPSGGEPVAVVLKSGRRVSAKGWSVSHYPEAYEAAPILTRGTFKITTLDGGHVLWEIVGVGMWSYSKRDAEATAKYLACPWERDNAAFRARHESVA